MTTTHRDIRFGIEIETIGQTRYMVALAIHSVIGGVVNQAGGYYGKVTVTAPDGRVWTVMSDASLSALPDYQAEVVSPIMHYTDMDDIQKIVRAVRRCGAKVDYSCGIHIHVDAAAFTPKAITNLVKIVHKQEALIEPALGISDSRKERYCKSIRADFLEKIEKKRMSLDEMNAAWYGRPNPRPVHYDSTRYVGLNLHNVWYRGTIEYRWFDGTLHAGKIKAYLQFALALAAKAINAKSASSKRREFNPSTAKYDFRVFLLSLGMIGDEFKTARLHLLSNFTGSAAWKNGRPTTAVAA